jgi:hypothetical protein
MFIKGHLLGVAQRQGRAAQGEGKLLLGGRASWPSSELGDGRRIVRRPAIGGSRLVGQAVPEMAASVGGRSEVAVDLAGDVTLQGADDFHLRVAFFGAPLDIDAGAGI